MHTSTGALGFLGAHSLHSLKIAWGHRGRRAQQRTLRSLWLLSGCTFPAAPAPSALQLPPKLQKFFLVRCLHQRFQLARTSCERRGATT